MAKGKRKRANKKKKVSPKGESKEKSETKKKTIYEMFPVKTLDQSDADKIKEIFNLSNNVSALIRDYAEKDIQVKKLRELADEIEKEKEPLWIQVSKGMFKQADNYKEMAKNIREHANKLEKSLVIVRGQIEHRYEDYVSCLIRHKRFIDKLLKKADNKRITGHRSDKKTKKEEEILFEKEFDEISDKDLEEIKKMEKQLKKKKEEK